MLATTRSLAQRVLRKDIDIVTIVAPAGFGKTHLAITCVEACGRGAVCTFRGEAQVGRAILEALIKEDPARGHDLGASMMAIATQELEGVAQTAWVEPPPGPSVFVFDDLEELEPSQIHFLEWFLERRPAERKIVLCSRSQLPTNLRRAALPHRSETIRVGDLRMSPDDVQALDAALDRETAQRIVDASAGWPMAALLFRRLAAQGVPVGAGLQGLAPLEPLMDYLMTEYLQTLRPEFRAVLQAAWAIPEVSRSDLATVSNLSANDIDSFLKTCPFVATIDGAVRIHNLLRAAFDDAGADETKRIILSTAIERLASNASFLQAAHCALLLHDSERAADLIQSAPRELIANNLAMVSTLLAGIDPESVLSRPALYLAIAQHRQIGLSAQDAAEESRRVFYALKGGSQPDLEVEAATHYALCLRRLGQTSLAFEVLDEITERLHDIRLTWPALLARGIALVCGGRYLAAHQILEATAASASETPEWQGYRRSLAADIAILSGHYDEGAAYLQEAVRIYRRRGATTSLLMALTTLATYQFLTGNEERHADTISEIRASLPPVFERTWSFWLACASGRMDEQPTGAETPGILMTAYLYGACFPDSERAAQAARLAHAEAHRWDSLDGKVLAAIACAERAPELRNEMLAELKTLSSITDLEPFAEHIRRYVSGAASFGTLDAFVKRLRSTSRKLTVQIELIGGRVLRGDSPTALSLRERAVLTYIAASRRYRSREEICDAIWPEDDPESAANNLKVLIHRLRKKLSANTIASVRDGYCIGPEAEVDLAGAEAFVASLRSAEFFSSEDDRKLRALYSVAASRPHDLEQWAWYISIDQRISALQREVALLLARSALSSRQTTDVQRITADLLERDPTDELAIELKLRAHLVQGDRPAARDALRQYELALREEGSMEVTSHNERLSALIAASP